MQPSVQQVKEWRLKLDSFANSAKSLTPSREVSLVITNLQRSKMWLGQALKQMDSPNPYPESKDPKSTVIEKQAEHTEDIIFGADLTDQTARVKFLRAETDKLIEEIIQFEFSEATEMPIDEDMSKAAEWAKKYLLIDFALSKTYESTVDAQMWLGMELNGIREKQNKVA
jgi:hypothetical protein